MPFAPAVVERTMKVQEVLIKAISGQRGYDGLWDRRRQHPSPRGAPVAEVARITRLYREQYAGFNTAHVHECAYSGEGERPDRPKVNAWIGRS